MKATVSGHWGGSPTKKAASFNNNFNPLQQEIKSTFAQKLPLLCGLAAGRRRHGGGKVWFRKIPNSFECYPRFILFPRANASARSAIRP